MARAVLVPKPQARISLRSHANTTGACSKRCRVAAAHGRRSDRGRKPDRASVSDTRSVAVGDTRPRRP